MSTSSGLGFVSNWCRFFEETSKFLEEVEIRVRGASTGYIEYALERLDMCINTCKDLSDYLQDSNHPDLEASIDCLAQLTQCLMAIHSKLLRDESRVESLQMTWSDARATAPTAGRGHRGRPQYDVRKEQIMYLRSLSFKWSEVAALLNISRMTLYRRRAEFGLLEDPSETISDTELISLVQEIKADSPYYGITMIWGCVRSRGIKVTRERLRRALKSIDPLGGALRWPSQIRRRPYSVGGPNSLWHIERAKSIHCLLEKTSTGGGLNVCTCGD